MTRHFGFSVSKILRGSRPMGDGGSAPQMRGRT